MQTKWTTPREYMIRFTGDQWRAYTAADKGRLARIYRGYVAALAARRGK